MNFPDTPGVAGMSFATSSTQATCLEGLVRAAKAQAQAPHRLGSFDEDAAAILTPGRLQAAMAVLSGWVSDGILAFGMALDGATAVMRRDWRPLSPLQRQFVDDLMLTAINSEIRRTGACESADGLHSIQAFHAASARCRGFPPEQLLEAARVFPATDAASDVLCDDDPPHEWPLCQTQLGVDEHLEYMRRMRQPWKPLARLHAANVRDEFPAVAGHGPVPPGWIDESRRTNGHAAFRRGFYRLLVQMNSSIPVRIAEFGDTALPLVLVHEGPSTARVMLLATADWARMLGLIELLPPSRDLFTCQY